MTRDHQYDVFVSYASEDTGFISQLVSGLKASGLSVWYDREILGGPRADYHGQKIELGLLDSRYATVILSKHYIAKDWTEAEFGALGQIEMRTERKVIIPVFHGIAPGNLKGRFQILASEPENCIDARKGPAFVVREVIRRMKDLDRLPRPACDAAGQVVDPAKTADPLSFSPLGRKSYEGDRCPECGATIEVKGHRITCTECDYDDLMEPY